MYWDIEAKGNLNRSKEKKWNDSITVTLQHIVLSPIINVLQESFHIYMVFRSFTITNILKFVIPLNCQEKGISPHLWAT